MQSINNETTGIFDKKLFFKTNGTAFKTKNELTDLMVLTYEQNSYLETFSVFQIQHFLTEIRNRSSSENLLKLTTLLEKTTAKNTRLDGIKAGLDALHSNISGEHFTFETQDTLAIDWFASVFQSISKMKNAIVFLKEALRYKIEIIEEIKIIFSKEILSKEDFASADNLVTKLKECLDNQNLKLEFLYAEIEEINETALEAIRAKICRNHSPLLFQPTNNANNMVDNPSSSMNSNIDFT